MRSKRNYFLTSINWAIKNNYKHYELMRNFLFSFDPEFSHMFTIKFLKYFPNLSQNFFDQSQISPILKATSEFAGYHLKWKNSLCLAAGLDKNAEALSFWSKVGFGAVEVGTITPHPQSGNPKPRLHRNIKELSLINSMGFPGHGSQIIKNRIQQFKKNNSTLPILINIGKQKETPIEKAIDDYLFLFNEFAELSNGIVVNISSPNTPDLRQLQNTTYLIEILEKIQKRKTALKLTTPLILKISPDEPEQFYNEIITYLANYNWNGLIFSNTTKNHNSPYNGGQSGFPLLLLNEKKVLNLKLNCVKNKIDFIYCGGLFANSDLEINHLQNTFKQVYTGFIFDGPKIFQLILKECLL